MEVADLVKLYAPLAGMLCMAFWLGLLSGRVTTAEREVRELKEGADAAGTIRDRLTRMETLMEGVQATIAKLDRGQESMQRQLGNLMQRGDGAGVIKMPGAREHGE